MWRIPLNRLSSQSTNLPRARPTLLFRHECSLYFSPLQRQSFYPRDQENFRVISRCHFFHTSTVLADKDGSPLRPSSKVEESVMAFKRESETRKGEEQPPQKVMLEVKPSLWKRVVDELKHYYNGFRLFFIDIRISSKLMVRLLRGETLTRREKRQMVRTTSDAFRLVPFSVFIIVPFMELLLPVFIKLFPSMLPSTFQTANEKEAKLKASLKVKLEMAKFLQATLDEMALKGRGHQSKTAIEFAEFFNKIRGTGVQATNEEILRFSKWFEDEITLDSLSRAQLTALCRVLEIAPIGTNNLLRFQLRMRLRSLAADDKVIQKEGIDSLTIPELQSACRARGMRALGLSEIRLKSQLLQWLDLSLNQRVPPSLLLLSRALYLPDNILPSDQLKATIASLPASVATQTVDAISQRRGKIDNAARIQALRLEEDKIREERSETTPVSSDAAIASTIASTMTEDRELLVDKAPVLIDKAVPMAAQERESLISADMAALENALENISVQRKRLIIEKEELDELKEEMAEYQEDIDELHDFLNAEATRTSASERRRIDLRESKAARRLFRSVNRMISRLDGIVVDLESRQRRLKKESVVPEADHVAVGEEIVSIEELISSIRRLKVVDDPSKLQQIVQVLGQIDQDQDGAVKVDHVLKVIELLGQEKIHMSPKQISEALDLVNKEELLEMEGKIEKALSKSAASAAGANSPPSSPASTNARVEKLHIRDMDHILPEKTTTSTSTTTSASSTAIGASPPTPATSSSEETTRMETKEDLTEDVPEPKPETRRKASGSQLS